MSRLSSPSGIAIGPILFIIALLAILAGAIAAGSGGFGQNTSSVNARVAASEIINYGNQVESATHRMLANGVDPLNLSFRHNIVRVDGTGNWGTNYNPNCAASSCEMYNINGGGMQDSANFTPYGNGTGAVSNAVSGSVIFMVFGVPNLGTSANELMMVLWNVSSDVCAEINKMVQFTDSGVSQVGSANYYWAGGGNTAVPSTVWTQGYAFSGANVTGKKQFCHSPYYYHAILIN